MSEKTKAILSQFSDSENLSSFTQSAQKVKQRIESETKRVLRKVIDIDRFHVIYTSGATESNDTALRIVKDAFDRHGGQTFKILSSNVEHHSFLEAMEGLPTTKVSYVRQGCDGIVPADSMKKSRYNFVTCMTANNETGSINDVPSIARHYARSSSRTFFHTDATQTFGKVRMNYDNCDSVAMSFHKTHGPKGIGLLLLKKSSMKKYDLRPLFPGTQNNGLRGGTENAGLVLAALNGLRETISSYARTYVRMAQYQSIFLTRLQYAYPETIVQFYADFCEGTTSKKSTSEAEPSRILRLTSPDPDKRLPWTMLLSFYSPSQYKKGKKVCNIKLRKCLYDNGHIVVSIGSTCLTGVKGASHVINSLTRNPAVKCGVVRLSMSPHTTKEDLDTTAKTLIACLEKQNFFQ